MAHADSDDDRRRTASLERRGWRVVRFWNNDILANPAGVEDVVLQELEGRARRSGSTAMTLTLPALAGRAPPSPAGAGEGLGAVAVICESDSPRRGRG
ncbi:MAG TPA: DUF559 domain-containing protein [Alphaproteobacteria bacterium]|nr:DUF559 domain-containing protein [Alphaproteobacteria bacterium]